MLTREDLIEELLYADNGELHGYSKADLEKMSDYSLRRTHASYQDQFDENT